MTISWRTVAAADQADTIWSDQRTVAAGTSDSLDLTNLTHTLFGSTLAIDLASVKAIFIVNTSTTSGDLLRLDSSVANGCTAPFGGSATSLVEIGADMRAFTVEQKRWLDGRFVAQDSQRRQSVGRFDYLQHRDSGNV